MGLTITQAIGSKPFTSTKRNAISIGVIFTTVGSQHDIKESEGLDFLPLFLCYITNYSRNNKIE